MCIYIYIYTYFGERCDCFKLCGLMTDDSDATAAANKPWLARALGSLQKCTGKGI